MKRFVFIIATIFIFLAPSVSKAEFPKPIGFVNDFAGVMNSSDRQKLDSALNILAYKTGVEIAVATVASLDEIPIEDYAVDLYKTWGIGKKGKDEGALILVAPSERNVRIEVGYGLEGAINDAMAGRIIREQMIPLFKENAMSGGILAGTNALVSQVLKYKGIKPEDVWSGSYSVSFEHESSFLSTTVKILFFILMIYLFIKHPWLFLLLISSGRGGGRGGFGGGFGGFGGGLSGGGGASGRW